MPTVAFPDTSTDTLMAIVNLPDGDSTVRVESFDAEEWLSGLYKYKLEFWVSTAILKANLIGAAVSVGLRVETNIRYFHGIVTSFKYLGEDSTNGLNGWNHRYEVTVRPQFWLLSQRSGCRIFQNDTLPNHVNTILTEHGITSATDYGATYTSQEFRVQYRESDFAFVSRLLEEVGIYYYFTHSNSATTLKLSDKLDGWVASTHTPLGIGTSGDIRSWVESVAYQPQHFEIRDYNYTTPTGLTAQSKEVAAGFKFGRVSDSPTKRIYDYPGIFATDSEGAAVATVRIEEMESAVQTIDGTSTSPCLVPGAKFQIGSEETNYYCVKFVSYSWNRYSPASFICTFSCFKTGTQFRPPRTTVKPFVHGPQTATVTGADTIDVDAYGSVIVRFHWDESTTADDSCSCRVRVSQAWAGNGYGSVMLPHQGQEVVVSFLEGDPDRPLITGRVYNADNMPPETLPDKKDRTIVAWDHAGNYIALDADEEAVDINNAADKFEYTCGMSASCTLGLDFGITIGCGMGINVGGSIGIDVSSAYSVAAGWSASLSAGGSMSATFGISYDWGCGAFVNAGDTLGQIAFKEKIEFDSMDQVRLVGGSGTNNSVIEGSGDGILLSYGPTDPAFGTSWARVKASLGLLGTTFLGTIGVGGAAAAAVLAGSAEDADNASELRGGAAASGTVGVAATLGSIAATIAMAKTCLSVSQASHSAPKATLSVNANGIELHAPAPQDISLMANLLDLKAMTDVVLSAKMVHVKTDLTVDGKFNSMNIQDIGNPAAAANARSIGSQTNP